MRESCAGYMIATAALFTMIWASVLAFVFRAGFRAGFAKGYSSARARILRIIDKIKARELFGNLLEDFEGGEE